MPPLPDTQKAQVLVHPLSTKLTDCTAAWQKLLFKIKARRTQVKSCRQDLKELGIGSRALWLLGPSNSLRQLPSASLHSCSANSFTMVQIAAIVVFVCRTLIEKAIHCDPHTVGPGVCDPTARTSALGRLSFTLHDPLSRLSLIMLFSPSGKSLML